MLRDEWTFEYTASRLAAAAQAQYEFRAQRVTFWEEKKAEVIAKIKDTGLTVSESIADGLSGFKYGSGNNPRSAHVMVDTTMQADLDECVAKIRKHRDMGAQYHAWVQVLEANPEARMSLHHDDWQFFFGK